MCAILRPWEMHCYLARIDAPAVYHVNARLSDRGMSSIAECLHLPGHQPKYTVLLVLKNSVATQPCSRKVFVLESFMPPNGAESSRPVVGRLTLTTPA